MSACFHVQVRSCTDTPVYTRAGGGADVAKVINYHQLCDSRVLRWLPTFFFPKVRYKGNGQNKGRVMRERSMSGRIRGRIRRKRSRGWKGERRRWRHFGSFLGQTEEGGGKERGKRW